VGPDADLLPTELAELVLPMSAGFGLGLPLRQLDDGVGALHLLDGAPLGIAVGVATHLLVEELGAGDSFFSEVELAHDAVEVEVHFIADFGFAVPNVVLVGALPLDRIGPVAPHDGVLHGDGREEVVDHLAGPLCGQFEGLFDGAVVELLDGAELG